jgi:hypothetical protein
LPVFCFRKTSSNDVNLSGYQQQLEHVKITQGKARNRFENFTAFTPNAITPVKYEIPDLLQTFKKGYHLMLQIQSS